MAHLPTHPFIRMLHYIVDILNKNMHVVFTKHGVAAIIDL